VARSLAATLGKFGFEHGERVRHRVGGFLA
jgi:hypothetical protein